MAAQSSPAIKTSSPPATPLMRYTLVVGTAWAISGLFLDGYAHISQWVESFFTWYHLVLYTGIFVPAGVLFLLGLNNLRRGYPLRRMLPHPYLVAVMGAAIFMVGGVADLAWHEIFGFEEDVEALLSPSHLFLATGGFLIFNAPILEFLRIKPAQRPTDAKILFPVWVAWFGHLSFITFFTQYTMAFAHPHLFVGSRPTEVQFIWDIALASHFIWPSVLLASFVLISLRYWRWPRGYFTVVLTLHAFMQWIMYWNTPARDYPLVIPGALLAGLLIDLAYARLQPAYDTKEARGNLRRFAFLVPLITFFIYFTILVFAYGVWWQIHMWLGAPFVAGVLGLMMALVAAPPGTQE